MHHTEAKQEAPMSRIDAEKYMHKETMPVLTRECRKAFRNATRFHVFDGYIHAIADHGQYVLHFWIRDQKYPTSTVGFVSKKAKQEAVSWYLENDPQVVRDEHGHVVLLPD